MKFSTQKNMNKSMKIKDETYMTTNTVPTYRDQYGYTTLVMLECKETSEQICWLQECQQQKQSQWTMDGL